NLPNTIVEPGRGLVGNAGIIEAEVVLIAKRSPEDEVRWVYLDIGKFHGLAETIAESIRYPIRTPRDRDEMAPCIIAGPTCDSVDVLYEKTPYPLPISLAIGDKVLIEAAGAYTATYSSVGFNGFPPLRQYVIWAHDVTEPNPGREPGVFCERRALRRRRNWYISLIYTKK